MTDELHEHEFEHEHEHHHDHGHEGHGHHHHHEHNHEGHDHHHDHEHEADEKTLIDDGATLLTLLDHSGSLVASYRFTLPCDLDTAKARLSVFAQAVSTAVDERGGMVGHIKAFARHQGDGFRISLTTTDPDIMDFPNQAVLVEGVAIVLAVDAEWYEGYITEQVKALLA